MNRFCGTKEESKKKTVNSDGNFFRVTFKSNDVYDATGFEAFYQFRKYVGTYYKREHCTQMCNAKVTWNYFCQAWRNLDFSVYWLFF